MKLKKENKSLGRRSVSESIIKRVSSGIPKFDKMIDGGFEDNSTNLIVGGVGAGKSIFGTQFLIEGINSDEPSLYISFEEDKKSFYSNMLEFGWDLEKLEKEDKFFFIEYTPEKMKTMLEEGGGIIESLILRRKIKKVVIDCLNSFELLFEDDLKKREAVLSLFTLLRKWKCTTLLLYEMKSSGFKEDSSKFVEFETDSVILLHFARKGKKRERNLEVLKMRGTAHSTSVNSFIIKKGIVLK